MKRFQFLMGFLCGAVLFCGLTSAASAASGIMAQISNQAVYVDGQKVDMEAYFIHDNNFVKLRDIGEAVGFNVYWDGSAVQVESDKPYTGEAPSTPIPTPAPSGEYTISADHWSREDFSRQANPAVFTGVYDRALYNTIRQAIVDGGAGSAPAYTMVAQGAAYGAVKNLIGRLDNARWFEHYVPEGFTNYWQYPDYFAVDIKLQEQYQAPLAFIQPVIAYVNQFGSDREKVTYLNDYLCTLLVYDRTATAGISKIFAMHDQELKAACASYAMAFQFLCGEAAIPCFTINTPTHIWNMVYADGQWLHVDVSTNDLTHSHTMLLYETYPNHPDQAPEATAFIKELLVPGSTLSK